MEDIKKVVNAAIAEHCQIDDRKHEEIKNLFMSEMKDLKVEIKAMAPTVQEVKDFQTFWKMGKKVGFGLASIITISGIIIGTLYTIKTWVNK